MAPARKTRVDPRLIIGIVLVAGSIAGVVGVVQSTVQTTTVYAMGQAVAAGDTITAIVIGVLYIKGLNPGPTLFLYNPQSIYAVFVIFIIAGVIISKLTS